MISVVNLNRCTISSFVTVINGAHIVCRTSVTKGLANIYSHVKKTNRSWTNDWREIRNDQINVCI